MTIWGFRNEHDARAARDLIGRFRGGGDNRDSDLPQTGVVPRVWMFKIPEVGIDAIDDTTPGTAICDVYWPDDNDDLVPMLDEDGDQITVKVFHYGPAAIGGSTAEQTRFGQAKEYYGRAVIDVAYCYPAA